jgi:hypothetical protein
MATGLSSSRSHSSNGGVAPPIHLLTTSMIRHCWLPVGVALLLLLLITTQLAAPCSAAATASDDADLQNAQRQEQRPLVVIASLRDIGLLDELDPLSADASAASASRFLRIKHSSRPKHICIACSAPPSADPLAVPAASGTADSPSSSLRLLLATRSRTLWYWPETNTSKVLHEGGVRCLHACILNPNPRWLHPCILNPKPSMAAPLHPEPQTLDGCTPAS